MAESESPILHEPLLGGPRGLSKSVISRVIIRVTPFRVLTAQYSSTYNPLTKSPGPASKKPKPDTLRRL